MQFCIEKAKSAIFADVSYKCICESNGTSRQYMLTKGKVNAIAFKTEILTYKKPTRKHGIDRAILTYIARFRHNFVNPTHLQTNIGIDGDYFSV